MTLIDVMFALAIAALVLAPIFISQGSAMERVRDGAQTISRLFRAQQFLIDTQLSLLQKKPFEQIQQIEKPSMQISYTEKDPEKNSALSQFPNIKLRTIAWEWQQDRTLRNDTFVTIVYVEPVQKEQAP